MSVSTVQMPKVFRLNKIAPNIPGQTSGKRNLCESEKNFHAVDVLDAHQTGQTENTRDQ